MDNSQDLDKSQDTRQKIMTDLQTWIRQNRSTGVESYFDEGDQPEVIPETAAALEVAVAVPEAAAQVKAPTTEEPSAFSIACDQFVAEALSAIASHDAVRAEDDALLAEHGGDGVAAMAALQVIVDPCTACDLSASRTKTVFGVGNPAAEVVFIGEAPGEAEDRQGEPFVGASGQLLTKILGAIGFARQDVYICNILKCRPPNNRDPLPAEVAQCEVHLKRQLALLRPRVICCLGRVAAQTLLKTDLSLGKLRNTVHFYEGVPVMATFHPAALLRNPKWKRDTWDDVRKLKALSEALGSKRI